MPDLHLPSYLQNITDLQLVPNYMVGRKEAHVCEQLAQPDGARAGNRARNLFESQD